MDTQDIRDLVEDATRHHGTPWKRVHTSDGGFYGVTDRNGSVVAGSPAITALIAQSPTLIPELLARLEQAEQAVQRVRAEVEEARKSAEEILERGTDNSGYTIRDQARADGYLQVVHYVTRALDGDGRG